MPDGSLLGSVFDDAGHILARIIHDPAREAQNRPKIALRGRPGHEGRRAMVEFDDFRADSQRTGGLNA